MSGDIPLNSSSVINAEIVLSERKVTNEFIVKEIVENVEQRWVRAEIEFGPFTEEERPWGTEKRGSSRRGINVWNGTEYDAVELVWGNTLLIAKIKEILEAEANPPA